MERLREDSDFQFFMIASRRCCGPGGNGSATALSILYDCFRRRLVPMGGRLLSSFQFFMIASRGSGERCPEHLQGWLTFNSLWLLQNSSENGPCGLWRMLSILYDCFGGGRGSGLNKPEGAFNSLWLLLSIRAPLTRCLTSSSFQFFMIASTRLMLHYRLLVINSFNSLWLLLSTLTLATGRPEGSSFQFFMIAS